MLEKSAKYALATARCGHAFCQCQEAMNRDEGSKEEIIWTTLAAAQGLPQAEWRMGVICCTGRGGVCKLFFTAAYWMIKAALQGDPDTQEDLGWTLLHAKMDIFDGRTNFVGHSAIPEATFWFETGEASMKAHGREFEKIEFRPFSHFEHCVKPCDSALAAEVSDIAARSARKFIGSWDTRSIALRSTSIERWRNARLAKRLSVSPNFGLVKA
jgi:TPR repeat protein